MHSSKKYAFLYTLFPFVALMIYFVLSYYNWIYSDSASNMVLARKMYADHRLLLPDWFYSTELPLFCPIQLFAFSFLFTDSWLFARWIAVFLICCLCAGSCIYYCSQVPGLKKSIWLAAGLLFIPYSSTYMDTMFLSAYYPINVAVMFFSVGAMLHYQTIRSRRGRFLLLTILFLLSLIVSAQSIRMLAILYLPLLLTYVVLRLRNKDLRFAPAAVSFTASLAGLLANRLLLQSGNYTLAFSSEELHFRFPSGIPFYIFRSFAELLGFQTFQDNLFYGIVCCILALLLLIAVIIGSMNALRSNTPAEQFTFLFPASIIVGYLALYLFTDMYFVPRYDVPILAFFFPLMLSSPAKTEGFLRHDHLKIILIVIAILRSVLYYSNPQELYAGIDNAARNRELLSIVPLLDNEHITKGYAGFEQSNILTELSDGRIEMWTLYFEDGAPQIYPCLQDTAHLYDPLPQDNCFFLYTKTEYTQYLSQMPLAANMQALETEHFYIFIVH